MEITVDTREVDKSLRFLGLWYPKKLDALVDKWLVMSSVKIRNEAVGISKVEARGVTGGYMRGWRRTGIKRDILGKFVKIFNTELYSKVLEIGGYWKKSPPKSVIEGELAEWVKRKGLQSRKREVRKIRVKHNIDTPKGARATKASHGRKGKYDWKIKQIAFAVGKALTKNKYEGKGQRFRNSPLSGRLLTMKRAVTISVAYMEKTLSRLIDKAFITR